MLELFRRGILLQAVMKGDKICRGLIRIYFLVPRQLSVLFVWVQIINVYVFLGSTCLPNY